MAIPRQLLIETSEGFPEKRIAGVDEVGRGCLAGPVVAAAVILPKEVSFKKIPWLCEIKDSKLLSAAKREYLAPKIEAWSEACGIGVASVEEINKLNIHFASHLAMVRAVEIMGVKADCVLVDGKFVPESFKRNAKAIIGGDGKSIAIAAASILAKVWRDRYMVELDKKFPGYDLASNKGYPTKKHKLGLGRKGAVLDIHRTGFISVQEVL